ncbi:phosphoglycolate phosphatase [Gallaecimonas kandeliae]|uniref:phosphoglycolate phosphatase n=1 Tax=Gallaecimonas kandeliae TaxID=3029055 RepID=UPI002648DE3A|nr:phosphoglycolate phosphatase [Gallaecimonas kandeliae]WKE65273.1 phosphoglycolate phosphatase [Gallaecimonas kandeliae]
MIKAVAFDLDGTLVHSLPDIAYAANAMRRQLGLAAVGEDRVGQWVGNGVKTLVERATVELGYSPQAQALFEAAYEENLAVHSTLLADAEAVLVELQRRGYRLAMVTNKARCFAIPLVRSLGLEPHFEVLLCGDDLAAKKPDPLPLTWLCERWQLAPEELVLVGDSRNDVEAAKAAGCLAVGLTGGYNYGEDIGLCQPHHQIDSLAALLTLAPLQEEESCPNPLS